jgi:hypothetical protein
MQVELTVHDDVALDEIEVYTDVLAAVAASDGPLPQSELDAALGLRCEVAQDRSKQGSRPDASASASPGNRYSTEDAPLTR